MGISISGRIVGRRLTGCAAAATLLLSACAADQGADGFAPLRQTSFSIDDLPGGDGPPRAGQRRPASETGAIAAIAQSPSAQPRTAASSRPAGALAEARELRLAGDKAKALAVLDRAAPGAADPAIDRERGLLALELGALDKARKLLQAAAQAGPADWRVHSALGAALAAEGKHPEAQLAFAKALELAPDHPSVLNNLALSYALDGKHEQAERLLRQAAQSKAAKPQARQNLALIVAMKGNPDEARRIAEAAVPPAQAAANAQFAAEGVGKGPAKTEPQRSADARGPGDTPIYRLGGPAGR